MNNSVLAVVCGLATAAPALAGDTAFMWQWERGDTGNSDRGGRIESVTARFDSATNIFNWNVVFSNQVTDGFTLAVSPGPNPKGDAGELALLYFDATGTDVVVNAHGYNGHNSATSYRDGSPERGNQAPERIATSLEEGDWVRDASVSDANGKREFNLEIDASVIQGFAGRGDDDDWTGVAFAERIGVWFHPFRNLTTSYDSNGYLNNWGGRTGWLDTNNLQATPVPMPAPSLIAAVGLGAIASRRRR